jgi:DNA-binding response OmpR family regulator
MLKEDEKTKKIPVLVFSNLGEEKDIKQVNDLGVNDFLVKSNYTLDELVIKIKSLIG